MLWLEGSDVKVGHQSLRMSLVRYLNARNRNAKCTKCTMIECAVHCPEDHRLMILKFDTTAIEE